MEKAINSQREKANQATKEIHSELRDDNPNEGKYTRAAILGGGMRKPKKKLTMSPEELCRALALGLRKPKRS